MEARGVRRFLQPALYVGIAAFAHALLFLIPGGSGKNESGQTRGVRLRVVGDPHSPPRTVSGTAEPPIVHMHADSTGGAGGRNVLIPDNVGPGEGWGGVHSASTAGGGGSSREGSPGGSPPVTEYGSYLARLKSESVQGWAKDSAGKMRQGWKGSGKTGAGWTGGAGSGAGSGAAAGSGGGSGGGGGRSGGGGYLDPRVQMVVTSYPPTGIEKRHTIVSYPELKVKKHEIVSGWWNVYIQMQTDANGRVVRSKVLRPETDGALERIFVDQVKKEIAKWTYDMKAAEINVDVRFYVE